MPALTRLPRPRTFAAMRRPRSRHTGRPIITLTTDFGLTDSYVAAMKAVLLRHCPDATLIDVTHNVPRHDVLCGAITLERAIDGFPSETVHLAVVDPGVGTDRRILIAELNGSTVVCPDNGLITWAWRLHLGGAAHELIWRPANHSNTFHGRDIMAPVAGMIAAGTSLEKLSRSMSAPILLHVGPSVNGARGEVIQIDHFGNATTNIPYERIRSLLARTIRVRNRSVGKLRRTYQDVAPGKPLALIGSSGLLEIAVRDGSASDDLKIKVGDEVQVQ
jgi:S-adenosylmethionine hydrolase